MKLRSTSVYCKAAYTNETSRVYDIFVNFCVAPREINKQGLQKITKK